MHDLTVTLPIPPRELSPNHTVGSRGQRIAKSVKVKAYRERARQEAGIAAHVAGMVNGGWTHARIQIEWYHPTIRFPDADNVLAWLKAGIDGIRDSGLLADDNNVEYPPVRREKDKLNPRVVLTITQLEGETDHA
jgi:Holliday junction resolvase RusA-like endonuclease